VSVMSQSTTVEVDLPARLGVSGEELASLCRRWNITELALFGSVLRPDFRTDSDVDVLVTFAPEAGLSVFDLADLQVELEEMFGRSVDVVEVRAVRNPFRRREILGTRRVVYPAVACCRRR
jgi:uncharacterized protein